jgi:hypothetical protein
MWERGRLEFIGRRPFLLRESGSDLLSFEVVKVLSSFIYN